MASIQDKIKACDYLIANMLDEQERIIYKNEDRIIAMNVAQFEEGMGSDGKILKNSNPIFDGIYSITTQEKAKQMNAIGQKTAGTLYNFAWTGNFLNGLQLEMFPNLVQFNIFSTGTGSGDKALFFKGYTNLFGLNTNNNRKLQYEIILPELIKFINKYL